ncbi:MAG: hypothetical protein KF730_07685 [Sphingomonas sp.]|uniref:hypothetical protein n=1 Tax=Sphingomonas sp. TaxID=28214 RepID=UPI0025F2B2A0|nr:hypothetical protein [Sphingomonas sp.]MBX3564441.1 hypothetical protein [Sphingomonas sp.]
MIFTLALLATADFCTPGGADADPIQAVRSFVDALNAHDQTAYNRTITEDADFVMGAGENLDLSELINVYASNAHLDIKRIRLAAPGVVEVEAHSSQGEDFVSRFKVDGGCVTEMKQIG